MPSDEKLADRLRRLLAGRREVVERKISGGVSFLVKGNMCCGLTSKGLMIRVGPNAHGRVLAEPHVRPMEFAGPPLAGFVSIDPEGCRTDTVLSAWLQRGIDFGSTLPAKQPAAKKTRRKH